MFLVSSVVYLISVIMNVVYLQAQEETKKYVQYSMILNHFLQLPAHRTLDNPCEILCTIFFSCSTHKHGGKSTQLHNLNSKRPAQIFICIFAHLLSVRQYEKSQPFPHRSDPYLMIVIWLLLVACSYCCLQDLPIDSNS
jgi:hypothetical protein